MKTLIIPALLLIPCLCHGFSDTEEFNKQITENRMTQVSPTQLLLQSLVSLQSQNLAELKKIRCALQEQRGTAEDDCYPDTSKIVNNQ